MEKYVRKNKLFDKSYIGYFSAAEMWDIPYIETVLGSRYKNNSNDNTVYDQNKRFSNNKKRSHSCELELPAGATVYHNGKMVASPELLFLQLARYLSIHRLILLGLQLCSHPPGVPSDAITSKQKISMFLEETSGHRGHRNALRAAKYLQNGSASVMESIAYMILTLPHSLGGYGLDGAVFNYEIKLKREAQIRLGQNRCFADLYYRQAKLAVEYESFVYHRSPLQQGKDMMRSAALERQNIGVMHLSTIQLYHYQACKDFAYNLAERLGKRIRIRTKKFNEMHTLLRELLPDKNSDAYLTEI